MVDNKYLKWQKQETLSFGNRTILVILKYFFNKLDVVILGDKERNYERIMCLNPVKVLIGYLIKYTKDKSMTSHPMNHTLIEKWCH